MSGNNVLRGYFIIKFSPSLKGLGEKKICKKEHHNKDERSTAASV
jgi:hypothetical protein